ncbi:DUF7549 family protein [Haloglomus salinum]|jgi:uncharacterized protein (TIGR04206 family)|uniref:DUF7549 family protein n=1 Tax=Haloglomus salinum TaxID=2962673 RepID=UPI0020C9B736|nr:TIGR04206 family protein [Haloglomus salinum]
MTLLRTKYAGELAVLATWASALLPWSVSFASRGGISLVVVRWQVFLFQFIFGASLPGEAPFQTVLGAITRESGGVEQAYQVWAVGAVVFLAALAVSVAYYAREEQVEDRLPVDPVRLLGGLLLVSGAVLGASTALLFTRYPGTTVPVGALFLLVFGAVLLRVEQVAS